MKAGDKLLDGTALRSSKCGARQDKCFYTVRAALGRLSALSVFLCKSNFVLGFWMGARGA